MKLLVPGTYLSMLNVMNPGPTISIFYCTSRVFRFLCGRGARAVTNADCSFRSELYIVLRGVGWRRLRSVLPPHNLSKVEEPIPVRK